MSEEQLFAIGLLKLAEQLHMSAHGAADPLPRDEETAIVEYLQKRLREWRPAHESAPWLTYDTAVKRLVEASLLERGLTVST